MVEMKSSAASVRLPHAVLDLPSRSHKARKIEQLLGLSNGVSPIRLLEVGTGSGGIAHYFATHPSGRYEVDAVDVIDNRQVEDGYRYRVISGTTLPFQDAAFDVVLSNHVIEHVGNCVAQMAHLAELRRVLRPGGAGYLAVPNRWMVVEPHYRLAFLSWLPRRWRSTYLRLASGGVFYDCEPLQMGELETMFAASGLQFENLCVSALRATFAIERPGSLFDRVLAYVPDAFIATFEPIIPTLIYRFGHTRAAPLRSGV